MKSFWGIILALFLFTSVQAHASNIEVQPTMYSKSMAQDRVWVGTFQLVWNDFIDKVVFNPVRFREGNPAMVNELNQKSFTVNDISEDCYYKFTGKVRKNTKKQISRAIRKKFKESSDILDKLNLTARSDMLLIYAMLKKDFEFVRAFDKLDRSTFSDKYIADYFGIDSNSDKALGKGVEVLFYNDPSDFAVKLATIGEDEVILYKNSSNKPFNFIYLDMKKKQSTFKGNTSFKKNDELKVPNISLFEEKVLLSGSGSFSVSLESGYNDLVVKQIYSDNVVLIMEKKIVVDSFAPILRFFENLSNVTTQDTVFTVVGEIESGCAFTVNGTAQTANADGTFSIPLTLAYGANNFEFVVTDAA